VSEINQLIPFLFLGAIFGVPLALVVGFVIWRAKRRRARLRGPWTALAQKFGGQFQEGSGLTGSSVWAQRPTHALSVRMTLVSVMDAVGRPFYPDGGTYTEVMVDLSPQQPSLFVMGNDVQTFVDHTRIPALAHLGAQARIFLEPKRARIVFPGVVEEYARLDAAAASLEDLTGLVLRTGPLPAVA
jgi:hypothetical protein